MVDVYINLMPYLTYRLSVEFEIPSGTRFKFLLEQWCSARYYNKCNHQDKTHIYHTTMQWSGVVKITWTSIIDNKMNIANKLYVTNQFYGCGEVGWGGGSDSILCFLKKLRAKWEKLGYWSSRNIALEW